MELILLVESKILSVAEKNRQQRECIS